MPKFGAHMSIAGGCFRCMEWGQQAGCDVVQLFSKNERQWLGKPLTDDDIAKFTDARTRTNVHPGDDPRFLPHQSLLPKRRTVGKIHHCLPGRTCCGPGRSAFPT